MAELGLAACSALEGVLRPGRSGNVLGTAGVTAREIVCDGVASLAARGGQAAALAEALAAIGLTLPVARRWTDGGGWRAVWIGPERWLLFGAARAERRLRDQVGALASVADQTDSRAILRLSGARVRDTLAKGLPIDLHPRAFAPGDAATTQAAHVGVLLWQLDDAPTYDLAMARSYAGSLADWLIASAAEYGLAVG